MIVAGIGDGEGDACRLVRLGGSEDGGTFVDLEEAGHLALLGV